MSINVGCLKYFTVKLTWFLIGYSWPLFRLTSFFPKKLNIILLRNNETKSVIISQKQNRVNVIIIKVKLNYDMGTAFESHIRNILIGNMYMGFSIDTGYLISTYVDLYKN